MGAEYSGRANYEDIWTKAGLWTADQIGGTVQKLIEAARFTKTGTLKIDVDVDTKLNVRYHVLGDLAQKDPMAAKRLEGALLRTFSTKHKAALVKAKASPVAERWPWFEGIELD